MRQRSKSLTQPSSAPKNGVTHDAPHNAAADGAAADGAGAGADGVVVHVTSAAVQQHKEEQGKQQQHPTPAVVAQDDACAASIGATSIARPRQQWYQYTPHLRPVSPTPPCSPTIIQVWCIRACDCVVDVVVVWGHAGCCVYIHIMHAGCCDVL